MGPAYARLPSTAAVRARTSPSTRSAWRSSAGSPRSTAAHGAATYARELRNRVVGRRRAGSRCDRRGRRRARRRRRSPTVEPRRGRRRPGPWSRPRPRPCSREPVATARARRDPGADDHAEAEPAVEAALGGRRARSGRGRDRRRRISRSRRDDPPRDRSGHPRRRPPPHRGRRPGRRRHRRLGSRHDVPRPRAASLIGRDPRDAWLMAQRICGSCTGVHALASVRAVEQALGIDDPAQRPARPQPPRRVAARDRPRDGLLPPPAARLGRPRRGRLAADPAAASSSPARSATGPAPASTYFRASRSAWPGSSIRAAGHRSPERRRGHSGLPAVAGGEPRRRSPTTSRRSTGGGR